MELAQYLLHFQILVSVELQLVVALYISSLDLPIFCHEVNFNKMTSPLIHKIKSYILFAK
jgi:hypothetical protein